MNTTGRLLTLTTFGESHGPAVGGVLDGMPPLVDIDMNYIRSCLERRRPGQNALASQRRETDSVEFLSGIMDGKSTGAPIAFIIRNSDQRTEDYLDLSKVYRPSHADYTCQQRYGIHDWRGGGRASARVTAPLCAAGALAMLALAKRYPDLVIFACTSQIGDVVLDGIPSIDTAARDSSPVLCPDTEKSSMMESLVSRMRAEGDSVGGCVSCIIKGLPAGIGGPVFDKLHAALGAAMLGINAAKGFEYGDGFASAFQKGSVHNDAFRMENGRIITVSNHSGGIQGGISNGQDIRFRVAFKPTPTIAMEQETVTTDGKDTILSAHGRHDACVVPRAVPIVEALAALVLLDQCLVSGKY